MRNIYKQLFSNITIYMGLGNEGAIQYLLTAGNDGMPQKMSYTLCHYSYSCKSCIMVACKSA